MASAVNQHSGSSLQHWSAEPSSINIKSPELNSILSSAMGVSPEEFDQAIASIKTQKGAVLRALLVLKGVELERTRLQNEAASHPDLKGRIDALEESEAEAVRALSAAEDALTQEQSIMNGAVKARDEASAALHGVTERLRVAGKGSRTQLNEKKRVLQIESSKKFSRCQELQKSVDAAKEKVEGLRSRIYRIRRDREVLVELQEDRSVQFSRIETRWKSAQRDVQTIQADLDDFIESFLGKNFGAEEAEFVERARYFLRYV